MQTVARFRALIAKRSYGKLRHDLATADPDTLTRCWSGFHPVEKLVLFKLLSPDQAMEVFGRLDFASRYFLFSGADLNTIAPVLEGLPRQARSIFKALPDAQYERMLHELACEAAVQ